jgi:hypothetical protein
VATQRDKTKEEKKIVVARHFDVMGTHHGVKVNLAASKVIRVTCWFSITDKVSIQNHFSRRSVFFFSGTST